MLLRQEKILDIAQKRKFSFLIVILFFFFFSCKKQNDNSQSDEIINNNLNTLIESCWNNRELEAIKSISTENFKRRVNNVYVANNQKEVEANIKVYFIGFPDLIITINNFYIKDNKTFLHWTFTGTNTGVFGETQATGKKVKVNGFSTIHYNESGKMFQEDVYYNELDLLQQLGYTISPPVVE